MIFLQNKLYPTTDISKIHLSLSVRNWKQKNHSATRKYSISTNILQNILIINIFILYVDFKKIIQKTSMFYYFLL